MACNAALCAGRALHETRQCMAILHQVRAMGDSRNLQPSRDSGTLVIAMHCAWTARIHANNAKHTDGHTTMQGTEDYVRVAEDCAHKAAKAVVKIIQIFDDEDSSVTHRVVNKCEENVASWTETYRIEWAENASSNPDSAGDDAAAATE